MQTDRKSVLQEEMREEGERKTKLEKEKHKQDEELELLQLKVRTGQFKRVAGKEDKRRRGIPGKTKGIQ